MATAQKQLQHPKVLTGERLTWVGWLREEMVDRGCTNGRRSDAAEFARRYGFAVSTVRNWLSGRRIPSMEMCGVIADNLDLLKLEVVCAAGHLHWSDIDDYTRAYANTDGDQWTGEL